MHGETVKNNSNIFHAYTFCATMESTGQTVKGGLTRDAHKIFFPSLYFYGGT